MTQARHPTPPEIAGLSLDEIACRYVARFNDRKPDWNASDLGYGEFSELLRSVRGLITGTRGLDARDLNPPHLTEDPGFNGVKGMDDLLTKKTVKHIWNQSGGGHSWPNWQVYLSKYAPLLFQ